MVWDGKTFPREPERTIGDILEGGLEGYYDLYHFDQLGQHEDQLLNRHGLSCEIFLVDSGRIKCRLCPGSQALTWEAWDPDKLRTRTVKEFLAASRNYITILRRLLSVIDFGLSMRVDGAKLPDN
jgi:hypothetical protein